MVIYTYMTVEKKFYVYKITNNVNSKVYIGKTNALDERWAKHQSVAKKPDSDRHHLIHQAIAKYGVDNFSFEEVESSFDELTALDRERYWIASHQSNTCRYGKGSGYNLTDGGDGVSGFSPTIESRKKMSDSHIGVQAGEKHPCATLKETDIHSIFQSVIIGMTDEKIASTLGVQRKAVSDIRRGKSWKHIKRPPELTPELSNSKRKISDKDVIDILNLITSGVNDYLIAEKFKVSYSAIRRIRLNEAWKHIPR